MSTAKYHQKLLEEWAVPSAQKNHFWFYGRVENELVQALNMFLTVVTPEDEGEKLVKTVHLNAPGGCAWEMEAARATIVNCKYPVHTYAEGFCGSAGFIIFAAGHRRFATKGARFMWHSVQQWSGYTDEPQMNIHAEDLKMMNQFYCDFLAEQTKKPAEFWRDMTLSGQDHYFGAKEAKRWGLVHEVLD